MSTLEKFYDNLYFIGLKSLLIDNVTWLKINEKYSIKVKLLSDGNSEIPQFAIMIINNFGKDIYEHRICISKLNDINGMSAIFPIMKRCSLREKTDYIFKNDLTNNEKPYSMCYVPVHLKPLTKSLFDSIKKLYDDCSDDLADKLKEDSEIKPAKIKTVF